MRMHAWYLLCRSRSSGLNGLCPVEVLTHRRAASLTASGCQMPSKFSSLANSTNGKIRHLYLPRRVEMVNERIVFTCLCVCVLPSLPSLSKLCDNREGFGRWAVELKDCDGKMAIPHKCQVKVSLLIESVSNVLWMFTHVRHFWNGKQHLVLYVHTLAFGNLWRHRSCLSEKRWSKQCDLNLRNRDQRSQMDRACSCLDSFGVAGSKHESLQWCYVAPTTGRAVHV